MRQKYTTTVEHDARLYTHAHKYTAHVSTPHTNARSRVSCMHGVNAISPRKTSKICLELEVFIPIMYRKAADHRKSHNLSDFFRISYCKYFLCVRYYFRQNLNNNFPIKKSKYFHFLSRYFIFAIVYISFQ